MRSSGAILPEEKRARQDLSERQMARLDEEAKRQKEGERDGRAQLIQAAKNHNQRVNQH